MKNSLSDLNNILFEQIERLNDDEVMEQFSDQEIERAKAISSVANQIIQNAALQLQAAKFMDDNALTSREMPEVLKLNKGQNNYGG